MSDNCARHTRARALVRLADARLQRGALFEAGGDALFALGAHAGLLLLDLALDRAVPAERDTG